MRIPTPAQRGAEVGSITVNPLQPVYKNTTFANNQEFSQNLSSLGDSALNIGRELDTRRVETTMRLAQADFDTVVRDAINPQTGLMSRRGGSARGVADEIDGLMEAAKGRIGLDKMTGNARKAVEKLYATTKESLYGKMAAYEIGQLDAYDTELSAGRIAGAADRASANPTDTKEYQTSILQAKDAAEKEAARSGLSPTGESKDAWDQAVLKGTSTVVLATVNALANTSAKAAQVLLDAALAAGDIDATNFQAATAALQPRIKDQRSDQIATDALRISRGGEGMMDPASPIMKLLHKHESGSGGYKTLYAQGQNSGFAGTDITKMTLSQLVNFSNPSGEYGQWVKPRLNPNSYAAQNGLTSTPMGKYQIVGGTLRTLIKKMGLTGDEVFDEAMQDRMFSVLMTDALAGPKTAAGKRASLRAVWEGFSSAGDAELDAAVASFESGDSNNYATPMDRINAEEDMDVRQMALRKYNAEAAAERAEEERQVAAQIDSFYAIIDSYSSEELKQVKWDNVLTQEERNILGTKVDGLHNWFLKKKSGEEVDTDWNKVNDMLDNSLGVNGVKAQVAFMKMDLTQSRDIMDDQTYNTMREKQRQLNKTDQDPDLPSLADITPTFDNVMNLSKNKFTELGIKINTEKGAREANKLVTQVMEGMQKKGMNMKGFEKWTDWDILNEIDMQSVRVSVEDTRSGKGDYEDVPLFQLGAALSKADAMADDLIAAAGSKGGGVVVGDYVLNAAVLEQAKAMYLDENRAFKDVYAEDLIEYVYAKVRVNNPEIMAGINEAADAAAAAVTEKGRAALEAENANLLMLAEQDALRQRAANEAALSAQGKKAASSTQRAIDEARKDPMGIRGSARTPLRK